jgi:hypothetical protein
MSKLFLISLLVLVTLAAKAPVRELLNHMMTGPEIVYGGPPHMAAAPHMIQAPPANSYGFDNYGNAIPQHPYAHINDGAGSWAIEPETVHTPAAHIAAPVHHAAMGMGYGYGHPAMMYP